MTTEQIQDCLDLIAVKKNLGSHLSVEISLRNGIIFNTLIGARSDTPKSGSLHIHNDLLKIVYFDHTKANAAMVMEDVSSIYFKELVHL